MGQNGDLIPDDSRARVRQRFGNVGSVKDSTRDVWSLRALEGFLQDFRFAVRSLRKAPAFTIAAIATLTLGIGGNVAVFSVANAVLLKPLHVPEPERVVRFLANASAQPSPVVGAPQFDFWRAQSDVFDDVSAHRLEFVNLAGESSEHIAVARVTVNFFRLFGARFHRGRAFSFEEDRPGGPKVALLSYELWTRRFGRDPQIVGGSVVLGGVPHLVVGILGPAFDTEQFDVRPDVWVPFQYELGRIDGGDLCAVTGRLRPGVTLATANARVKAADSGFREHRARLAGRPMEPGSPPSSAVEPLMSFMAGSARSSLRILAGAVVLVLLIACANVASLLLARGSGRRREIAIRNALGASRGRIVRQLLVECLALSMAGGLAGLLLGSAGIRALLMLYPRPNPMMLGVNVAGLPRIGEGAAAVVMDWRVLAFAVVVSAASSLLFGLLPALQSSRADLNQALTNTAPTFSSGLRQSRIRALLVVSELALALMLVVGAALLIRTFQSYLKVQTGFDPRNVLTMRMAVSGTRFETRAGIEDLTREGARRVRALPGVVSASTTCCMPLETVWQLPFVVQSRAQDGLTRSGNLAFHGFGGWTFVSPQYFDVLGIPILRGRDFNERDTAGAPGVVIINETMARLFWKSGDPLNDSLVVGRGMRPEYDLEPLRQVIGIVRDVRTQALTRTPRPEMYVPVAQVPDGVTALNVRLLPIVWMARTSIEPHAVGAAMSKALTEVSSGLSVARVRSMSDVIAESTGRTRFDMWLMTIFGGSALLLAAVGIYGLIAYAVEAQTKEIGIRLALGAAPHQIRNMMMRQGLVVAVAGIVVGTVASLGLERLISSLLFGVTARDPLILTVVPLLLAGVAMAAIWLPARRATRIEPLSALRRE